MYRLPHKKDAAMNISYTEFIPIFLLSLSLIITLMVMLRAWHYRVRPAVKAFLWMMAALVWWLLSSFFENTTTSLSLNVFWLNMGYLGITMLPVIWLVFTMQYTERGEWWVRRGLPLLFVIPVITLVLVWTNGQHYLMWNEIHLDASVFPPLKVVTFNTWFWVHAVYSYLLLLYGTINLFKMYFRTSGIYRKQVGIMLLAAFIPWVANYIYIGNIGLKFSIDPTPMTFVFTGLAFIWGLSHVKLLTIMPVAYEAIFKSISDGVIVLNAQNRIRESNPAVSLMLRLDKSELLGKKLCRVIPGRAYSLDNISDSGLTETIISIGQDRPQHFYKMYVSPISDRENFSGRLVILHDDTERRKAENESREKAILKTELNERKKMQQALSDSSRRLQALSEESPVMICNIDLQGNFNYVNKKFEEVTKYSRQEILGKNGFALNMFDADTSLLLKERIKGKIVETRTEPVEIQYIRKDGERIWLSMMAKPIREDNVPVGIQIIAQDVTEQRQMGQAMRESEERYRMIFESANDVIILTDKDGKIVDINKRIVDIGGYDRDVLLGKNFRALTKMMPRKSIAIVAKNFLLRRLGHNIPAYEVDMYRANGEMLNIEINAVNVKDDDKVIGTLATLRDVTERRKSESALKYQRELIDQIIATIPNAVLVINKDTKVLLANDTFYRDFRLRKKEVENRPISDVIRINEMEQALTNIIKTSKKSLSLEFRLQLHNTQRDFAVGIVKMQNQRYLIFMNDITEEREKQERLYLTDRLVSVGEMASGVAHELNNPLTSIIGLSSLLTQQGASEEMSEEMQEDLNAINSEAQRCAAIVKNLLSFARKHASMREPVQVTKILEDVLKLRSYEHKAQNITVETSFASDLPEVRADYFQIQQVFLNIIINAENAMVDANGRGNLKIKIERVNGYINTTFEDNGPGISKENLGVIFNPFFTTKEVGKGTGLGLSISYGIVASHGGKIYAKSSSDKGATFIIELPTLDN